MYIDVCVPYRKCVFAKSNVKYIYSFFFFKCPRPPKKKNCVSHPTMCRRLCLYMNSYANLHNHQQQLQLQPQQIRLSKSTINQPQPTKIYSLYTKYSSVPMCSSVWSLDGDVDDRDGDHVVVVCVLCLFYPQNPTTQPSP